MCFHNSSEKLNELFRFFIHIFLSLFEPRYAQPGLFFYLYILMFTRILGNNPPNRPSLKLHSALRFKVHSSVAELSEFLSSQDFYIALRETSTALGMFGLLIFG